MHSKGICNDVYVFLNELLSLYNITKMNHLKWKENKECIEIYNYFWAMLLRISIYELTKGRMYIRYMYKLLQKNKGRSDLNFLFILFFITGLNLNGI